jgi:hypothetical protein
MLREIQSRVTWLLWQTSPPGPFCPSQFSLSVSMELHSAQRLSIFSSQTRGDGLTVQFPHEMSGVTQYSCHSYRFPGTGSQVSAASYWITNPHCFIFMKWRIPNAVLQKVRENWGLDRTVLCSSLLPRYLVTEKLGDILLEEISLSNLLPSVNVLFLYQQEYPFWSTFFHSFILS